MGPLIDQQAVDAMQSALERIRAQGGEIIQGGDRLGGCYVRPTLVKASRQHADRPAKKCSRPSSI
jgi:aldehyde dehydrogenase (NAD+)